MTSDSSPKVEKACDMVRKSFSDGCLRCRKPISKAQCSHLRGFRQPRPGVEQGNRCKSVLNGCVDLTLIRGFDVDSQWRTAILSLPYFLGSLFLAREAGQSFWPLEVSVYRVVVCPDVGDSGVSVEILTTSLMDGCDMARACEVCGKAPQVGNMIETRGKAKYLGGVGTKITGITRRRFLPNLQNIKASLPSGEVRTMRVCTQCIRSGRIRKAVRTKPFSLPTK